MSFIDKRSFCTILFCLLFVAGLNAQKSEQITISCTFDKSSLKDVLVDLEKRYDLVFYYTDQQVKNIDITININEEPLEIALNSIFSNTKLDFKISDEKKVIIFKKKKPGLDAQKKNRFLVSGSVSNISGEKLIGAHIIEPDQNQGVISNNLGIYGIYLLEDTVEIIVSYVGHESLISKFYLNKDTILSIVLINKEIGEVVIRNSEEKIHESTQVSKLTLSNGLLNTLPSFLGEPDIIKSIQIMPGVQSGIEGEGYLYVRGGGPEQNLILFDNVPIFQSSHMLGLVPYFNSSVINHVDVLKGGFPARYGGRISSVVDIDLKEGNAQEYHGNINIDPLMSQLMIEGPLLKGKTSFIVSGRRTYIDLIAYDYLNSLMDNSEYDYQVYDINAKINHKFSNKSNISFSFFRNKESADYYYYYDFFDGLNKNNFELNLENTIFSAEWNKMLSRNLSGKIQLSYNNTLNDIENSDRISMGNSVQQNTILNFVSSIKNTSLSTDFLLIAGDNHDIRFGLKCNYQVFNPASFNSLDLSNYTIEISEEIYAFSNMYYVTEIMTYIEDEFDITDRLKTNLGLNYSYYNVGSKNYNFIEPRISARYLLAEKTGLKLSYSAMHQYIHFLVNFGYSLPVELWVPSTEDIKPTLSHQYVVGLSQVIKDQYEISIEGYYKTIDNSITFKDGSTLDFVKSDWEENIISGQGRSYGLELFVQKKLGSLKGWVGYTLSWTERQFDDLNNGEWYPYKYDRRHDINCTLIKTLFKNFEISAQWVYGTGNAITIPLATFDTEYWSDATVYSERNSYRMNAYHRLDINLGYTRTKNKTIRKWSIGLYNAYNRHNPFFIRYNLQENNFTQYSLFPIIPSISYNLKF